MSNQIIKSLKNLLRPVYRPVLDFKHQVYLWILDYQMKKKGYILDVEGLKSRFYLPYVKTDYIQNFIYTNKNYYEYENLNFVCKKWNNGIIGKKLRNGAVLDIGANIGNHTLFFINECEAKLSYCFEPAMNIFKMLKMNMRVNHVLDRVKLLNVGVAGSSGKANVDGFDKKNIGGTTISISEEGQIDVVSIDELGISERIILVKIDVEGFEVSCLKGMKATLEKNHPYIMIEVRDYYLDEVCSLMKGLNYEHIVLDRLYPYQNCLFYPNSDMQ